jgi:hypothetical protein
MVSIAPYRRRVCICLGLVLLCIVALNPARGVGQAAGSPAMPAGMTSVPYIYKGQSFEFRVYKGEVVLVIKDNFPVLMVTRGTTHPLGQDANTVNLAEQALKAYKAGTPSEAGGGSAPGAAAKPSSSVTVDDVIGLLNAGLSDDLIIAKIQKSNRSFDLSADDMIRLKKAKASDAVIKAMMNATPAPGPPVNNTATPESGTATTAGAGPAPTATAAAPNVVAENPNMGKLPKESFLGAIGHQTTNVLHGKTVIDKLSMRNILPQWDPSKRLDQQYPHIAFTVLYAPMGWTDDYREVLRRKGALPNCFKLKGVVWLDATRSKNTDEFEWCIDHDMYMSEFQPTYLMSLAPSRAAYGQTTGINRTDGPQPPDKLLPNDRATLDMQAKTNPQGASKDLNLDQTSLFAIMFANIRKDLGETLGSDGDYRVWITTIKKASGPPLF